jgi:hypothetical protein
MKNNTCRGWVIVSFIRLLVFQIITINAICCKELTLILSRIGGGYIYTWKYTQIYPPENI